jgi:hypothetical protein
MLLLYMSGGIALAPGTTSKRSRLHISAISRLSRFKHSLLGSSLARSFLQKLRRFSQEAVIALPLNSPSTRTVRQVQFPMLLGMPALLG